MQYIGHVFFCQTKGIYILEQQNLLYFIILNRPKYTFLLLTQILLKVHMNLIRGCVFYCKENVTGSKDLYSAKKVTSYVTLLSLKNVTSYFTLL